MERERERERCLQPIWVSAVAAVAVLAIFDNANAAPDYLANEAAAAAGTSTS